jgi:hypothetical protein
MPIESPLPEGTPPILYKYRFFDDKGYHIRIIENAELWLPSARSFNDPFDSSLQYNFDGLDGEPAEKWVRNAIARQRPDLPEGERKSLAGDKLREIRSHRGERLTWLRRYFAEENYKTLGICSFASIWDSIFIVLAGLDPAMCRERTFCL